MRLFAGTPFDRPPRCEKCGELEPDCHCAPSSVSEVPAGKQTLTLRRERRKNGKQVTVIRGLQLSPGGLSELLSRLKSECGAGGTVADATLEIQGDQTDRLRHALQRLGFRVQA